MLVWLVWGSGFTPSMAETRVMVHTVTPALWVETEVAHCLTRKIQVHHRVLLLPFCF